MSLKDSGIYCIEHIGTGKKYVGSAENLERRFKKHLSQLRKGIHHSYKLQAAWAEHGEDAFEINILLRCPKDELMAREQEAIDNHNAVAAGYNVAMFAFAPNKGIPHSAVTKAKMRDSHKKRPPISEETRQRLREAAAEREKLKKQAGFQVTDETRAKLKAKLTGRPVSAETRAKLSLRHSGKPLSEEHCKKLAEAHKGYAPTDEHRKNLSEAGKRRWAKERESAATNHI